ncbi:MAG TPA: histidine phosphatase family protein [Rhodanobacteraceae bacterium]|jgi:phosphohistidine phosphatase SixA|nr:histidine phosphatase family protein [Rhodanobacteraceae bacterium]
MRELLLLRHAEAMHAGPDGRDVERPLSVHGEAEARAVGAWLAAEGAEPEAVLCSPARRAQMTADAVCRALRTRTPRFLPAIYEATPGELLAQVETHAADARQVLLVGHNPGLEQLLGLLLEGRSDASRGLSPAALAWLELPDGPLEPGSARLRTLWSP